MTVAGKKFTTVVGNKTVTIETGRLAGQAGGAEPRRRALLEREGDEAARNGGAAGEERRQLDR